MRTQPIPPTPKKTTEQEPLPNIAHPNPTKTASSPGRPTLPISTLPLSGTPRSKAQSLDTGKLLSTIPLAVGSIPGSRFAELVVAVATVSRETAIVPITSPPPCLEAGTR